MWLAFKAFVSGNMASLVDVLGIAAAAIGALAAVRHSGVTAQQNDDMKAELKSAGVRNDVEQKVDATGDAANLEQLQQWDRK